MKRGGFTLIELLVVIAIIAILAAILFPVFARARAKAQQNNCLSNTKQLALGVLMYASDYDDRFPYAWRTEGFGTTWGGVVHPYVKNLQIFVCPASTTIPALGGGGWGPGPALTSDYAMNGCLGAMGGGGGCVTGWLVPIKQSSVYRPAEMIMLRATEQGGWFYTSNPDTASAGYVGGDPTLRSSYNPDNYWPNIEVRHMDGGNVAFCDGHSKWLSKQKLYSWAAADVVMWNNTP